MRHYKAQSFLALKLISFKFLEITLSCTTGFKRKICQQRLRIVEQTIEHFRKTLNEINFSFIVVYL